MAQQEIGQMGILLPNVLGVGIGVVDQFLPAVFVGEITQQLGVRPMAAVIAADDQITGFGQGLAGRS